MVRVNSPGVCTAVKSKTRHVRRSLSAASLDVRGSVVMEKVWMFEGITGKAKIYKKKFWFQGGKKENGLIDNKLHISYIIFMISEGRA
jgi:hypothetical protein